MDLRRLRAGEWMTAAFGAVLAVSLFLPWYEREPSAAARGRDFSAWETFAVLDVLLLALAVLAVGLLFLTAVQPAAAVPVAADALLTLVATPVALLTLVRVLDPPGSADAAGGEVTPAAFAWLGLAGVLGVLIGTVVAMRDERLSKEGRLTDATGVPVAAAPEIETLPAPRPEDARE